MSADARAAILGRIRSAVGPGLDIAVPRAYAPAGAAPEEDLTGLLAERIGDYRAHVVVAHAAGVARAVRDLLAAAGAGRAIVPQGLPADWRPEGVATVEDDGETSHRDLDAIGHAVTGCALAIARLGSLVFDHGLAQGRRALTLVPDHHVCVVRENQIVAGLPDALAKLAADGRARRPITIVSGPSATSDIELRRVEGVHGPRRLDVVIVRC